MPDLASTSRVALRYIREASFGVTPTTGNPKELRFTGESLDYVINKEVSQEINNFRNVSSQVPVSAMSQGGVQGEMQYAEYDEFIESVMRSAPVVYGVNGVGATFSADFTATTITAAAAPSGASAFTTLKPGQWFKVNAGANANNGKVLRVSKTVAPTSTVITLDASTPAVVSAGVANVSLSSSRFQDGDTSVSFSIEREAGDVGEFMNHKGQTASKWTLNIASGSLTSTSFDFMGAGFSRGEATQLPGTPIPSNTYDIHSGVEGASCHLWEGGAPITSTFVKSIALDYDNALRMQDAICNLNTVAIGSGQIVLGITMEVYFADGSLYDKFINNAYTELVFSTFDKAGNGYVITVPRANISSFSVQAGSKDSDLMASISFTGLRDAGNPNAALRKTIFVDRVGAAVSV